MGRLLIPRIAVALVAIEHVYILVLEMFFWNKPLGMKTFNLTQELADATTTLAANQGLYNGFLAAGLFWGLFTAQWNVVVFFLSCVIVAALYGACSVNKRIFFVQGVPAIAALAAVLYVVMMDAISR